MSIIDPEAQDAADMARLAAGHDAALNALMARHASPLFGFLCRFLQDEEAAHDLAQETFVRVYRHRAEFRAGQRFSPWLFTLAGNLARNHLRSRSRRPEVPLEDPAQPVALPADPRSAPDEEAQRTERLAAVRAAVAELPAELREAVALCELDDRPLAEAAAVAGTTVKAIESRLYRARQQLRLRLARWLATG